MGIVATQPELVVDVVRVGGGLYARPRYAAPPAPEQERDVILEALRMAGSNRTRAARRLGMSRSTLWAKLKLHGIA